MNRHYPFYHGDGCGCGHRHGQESHHEHGCGCGGELTPSELKTVHGPGCHCELCHPHAEYCDVCGQSLANCTCAMPDDGTEKAVYDMQNLGCANCAAKMEHKIRELPGVKYASVTFATGQLRLSADHQEELLPLIQEICSSIESGVRVVPRKRSPGNTRTVFFTVKGISSVNDGEELERRAASLSGVLSAVYSPAGNRLTVTAASPGRLLPEIKKICVEISPGMDAVLREDSCLNQSKDGKTQKKGVKVFVQSFSGKMLFLAFGIAAFAAGIVTRGMGGFSLLLFAAAWLFLGWEVLADAVKSLLKGHALDENFLMCVASGGAFAIGDYAEAVAVILLFCIGELFEERAVERSRNRIMEAADMRPETVCLLVGEERYRIPAADSVVGDILLVVPGERIPLDGVIIEGESSLDTSPVTGESVPVAAGFGDEVTSGCVNLSGMLKIRVEKVLTESMVSRILDSVEQAAAGKPKMDRFITRFARIYTPCVVGLAFLVAVLPSLYSGNWNHWIYTALTFLVISCPCALVLSVPLAFFSGIGLGSRFGILFKNGSVLESLRDTGALVLDKTGTLTTGEFRVSRITPAEGFSEEELLGAAACAESVSTHPLAVPVLKEAERRGVSFLRPSKVRESAGKGIVAEEGERILCCGNALLMEEQEITVPAAFRGQEGTVIYLGVNGCFAGFIIMSDTLKSDAAVSVAKVKKQGIVTVMLTGDSEEAAAAAAAGAGVDEYRAGLLPMDKLNALVSIRNHHGPVFFVGDGINDAPVLAGADTGAAMGSGADAAIEAADVVFMNSGMNSVPVALAIAKKVNRTAVQNIVFALGIKFLIMILGLLGFAGLWSAVFADTGVAVLCVLNSIRLLSAKRED